MSKEKKVKESKNSAKLLVSLEKEKAEGLQSGSLSPERLAILDAKIRKAGLDVDKENK